MEHARGGSCRQAALEGFSCKRVGAGAMGGVRAWAAKRIGAVLASLQPPDVALNVVSIRGGDLYATLTGESIPRRVQNIDLKLRLGRDYRSLTLDLTGARSCWRLNAAEKFPFGAMASS